MPLYRHRVGSYPENELTRNLSGNIRLELAEPLWTDPVMKGGISVRELISTLKKKKKQEENEWSNVLLQILTNEDKPTTASMAQHLQSSFAYQGQHHIRQNRRSCV